MQIPFLDIHAINKEFYNNFSNDFKRVLNSGSFVLADELNRFEESFAEYCGTKYCIGVGNGFQAIEIILRAWNIKKGDCRDACLKAIKLKMVDCLLLAKNMKCKTILLCLELPRLRCFQ